MDLAEAESPLPARADFGRLRVLTSTLNPRLDRTGGDLFDTLRIGTRVAFLLSDIAGKRPELDPIAAEMQRVFRATSTELFSAVDANLMEAAETLILALNHALIAVARGVRFARQWWVATMCSLGSLLISMPAARLRSFTIQKGSAPCQMCPCRLVCSLT